ncbi:MAG TPA: TlpA disulfide reductase family protein [Bryobacteraceae bacterium]|nr:TlpA disulfide reductase family protein [Bryobacteraceae bacterium]
MRVLCLSVAAALILTGCSSRSKTVKAASVKADKDRKKAPDFELKDANGHTVRLSDYRGKVVLLDFWATWCGPCKIEIPWFEEFERQNRDKGFAVIGVAMDEEGWEVVKPFAQRFGINYRVVVGNDSIAELFGGVDALPTTFLIDRDGKIASVHVGLSGRRDFEDGIQELLEVSSRRASARAVLAGAE